MTANGILQIFIFFGLVLLLTKPIGVFLKKVYDDEPHLLKRLFGRCERLTYKLVGVDPTAEMNWKRYSFAMLSFSLVSSLVLYGIQRLQGYLPRRFVVQHRGFVRNEHQLAGLFRGSDHELFHSDGRPGGSEFRLGGSRHGAGDRIYSGYCPTRNRESR